MFRSRSLHKCTQNSHRNGHYRQPVRNKSARSRRFSTVKLKHKQRAELHFALDGFVVRAEGALEHRRDRLFLARLDLLGRFLPSAHFLEMITWSLSFSFSLYLSLSALLSLSSVFSSVGVLVTICVVTKNIETTDAEMRIRETN